MMNLSEKSLFSFFAGAQVGSHLFGSPRLAHEFKSMGNSKGKNGRRGERNSGSEKLDRGGQDIHRCPDGDRFHEVGTATREDEKSECQEHPVKGNVSPSLIP